jgi:hypothetical protein
MAKKRGHNEGSIYRREDGRWIRSANLGIVNGKRKRKDFYGDTRRELQEKLTKALVDIQNGPPVAQEKQTVAQYFECWLEDVAKRKLRPLTHRSYEQNVRLYIGPFIGNVKLARSSTCNKCGRC